MSAASLIPDDQEVITPGEAMAGMILHGLGVANRPLSLTPQFVANKPLTLLFREDLRAKGGWRFLKALLFFVSSLLVKKPGRIAGLLLVMTLAVVVYSVAQRRPRQQVARHKRRCRTQSTNPPHSRPAGESSNCLEGMHCVRVTAQGQVHDLLKGLNDMQIKILRLFGEQVCCFSQISSGEGAQCRMLLPL